MQQYPFTEENTISPTVYKLLLEINQHLLSNQELDELITILKICRKVRKQK